MRPICLAAAAASLLCAPASAGTGIGKGLTATRAAAPGGGGADHSQLGTVTAVDPAKMTFACHWSNGNWTYEVSRSTNLLSGHDKVAFSGIKVGQTVQVLFHFAGKREIANLVVIEQ